MFIVLFVIVLVVAKLPDQTLTAIITACCRSHTLTDALGTHSLSRVHNGLTAPAKPDVLPKTRMTPGCASNLNN